MAHLRSLAQLISLKGKVALVTGAAAGISKAIAYLLPEVGAELGTVDIDGESRLPTRASWKAWG